MVGVKTFIVSIVAVLFAAFQQPGIRAQPTIDSSTEDDSCSQLEEELVVENTRLQGVLERERQTIKKLENERHRLKTRKSQSVIATSMASLNRSQMLRQITKVEDKIYVIDHHPNRIEVYEFLIGFRFISGFALSGTDNPFDIVYSNQSKYVYISDYEKQCIWVLTTTGEHRLSKWLNNVNKPHTLSLSNEGHLLVLRRSESLGQDSLEIYSLNATLIRRVHLPQDVRDPEHVVQTSAGNFIILHRLNNTSTGQWVMSQLTTGGHLIHRFIPRNQLETLHHPYHLSLDSENNRLFVADHSNHRVILFDSNDLTWSQVLLSRETNGIHYPRRLFYDASKRHLFLSHNADITVYEIN